MKISDAKYYIEYGIPQGSVLGPILFLLFINAVSDVNIDGKIVPYANTCYFHITKMSYENVLKN